MLPNHEFTEDQKQYLAGFVAGAEALRAGHGLPTFAGTLGLKGQAPVQVQPAIEALPLGPEGWNEQARRATESRGGKLCAEELAKRKVNGLDVWDQVAEHASQEKFPKGTDVLLFKFQGLFFVAPAQNSYMTRLRFAAGIIQSWQLRGLADLAEQFAGQYADVTTRANLQLREIQAADGMNVLKGLQDLAIVNRGSGADNIRNITAPCTAGIDPAELFDVRDLCRDLNYYILNHRELYGLPRKFNIAFDGGGVTTALEDTNDIGFVAVRVIEGKSVPAGIYFRVQLGGITGHRDFARDTGLLLKPAQCIPATAAMLRVFIEHGDRTDRKKSRLKYLLDQWGFERFLNEAEKHFGTPFPRLPLTECELRVAVTKHAHVGRFTQKQQGLTSLGVVLPVGRMTTDQMRGLAKLAERYGNGSLRLTVWQNILLPDIKHADLETVEQEIEDLGLTTNASSLRSGLVACTGNAGCKFAAANTKKHALELIETLEERLQVGLPVNIHLTGCHHSCAQHYIGDIGCLATKVARGEEMVEGYHIFVGGGYAAEQGIGREILRDVPASELPDAVEGLLRSWLTQRESAEETFRAFVLRTSTDEIRAYNPWWIANTTPSQLVA